VSRGAGPKQRVQKVLARAGVGSRRSAEALIAEGRVRIGGKKISEQGMLVDPTRDAIIVDGRRVGAEPLAYLVFHKPREVMCTMSDPEGRRSVVDYLGDVGSRVVPVGRLDYQTSGVLLLTNDGDFARGLLHPSGGVLKEYLLKLKGAVDTGGLERLRGKIAIGGRETMPARVDRVRADDSNTWLRVTLHEGKNRQVRKLAEYAGYRVMRLTRTRFAGLSAEGLRPGQWRHLSAAELRSLRAMCSEDTVIPRQARPPGAVPPRSRGRGRGATPARVRAPSASPRRVPAPNATAAAARSAAAVHPVPDTVPARPAAPPRGRGRAAPPPPYAADPKAPRGRGRGAVPPYAADPKAPRGRGRGAVPPYTTDPKAPRGRGRGAVPPAYAADPKAPPQRARGAAAPGRAADPKEAAAKGRPRGAPRRRR